jgi:ribosomal peptide maturation radical SAM protein 1
METPSPAIATASSPVPAEERRLVQLADLLGQIEAVRTGTPPAPITPQIDGGLSARLGAFVAGLDRSALLEMRREVSYALLADITTELGPGRGPAGRPVFWPAPSTGGEAPRVALVSLPWMAPTMPSIQLATLAAALAPEGIECECLELYLDYAAWIGLPLYHAICDTGQGFVEEWLFARDYFRAETGAELAGFHAHRPRLFVASAQLEDRMLDALSVATEDFLAAAIDGVDWSRFDIVGVSLTIYQLGAAMAFCRRLKERHPEITVVCGGSQCAGPMGTALLRVCPSVDVAVRVEGEPVFPALVRRLRAGRPLADLPGVSWRAADGTVVANPAGPVLRQRGARAPLAYDAYFARLTRLGLDQALTPWLPFESSRGCWWGEKTQCTFCGLHEIMKYRSWTSEQVLAELEGWAERYGVARFFAVDLILPRDFFDTFLPEIVRRGHDWQLFYEVKANLRRSDVELLAAAGVRWLQPGIESLDRTALRLMKKGVTPLQNVQLLKWCRELGIRVSWTILSGTPGEDPAVYPALGAAMKHLVHLPPPSGVSPLELHRFSPYFDHPEEHGIERLGPHPLFGEIFPLPPAELDELVYLHVARPLAGGPEPAEYARPVAEECTSWQRAADRAAALEIVDLPDGAAEIFDSRTLPERTWRLTPPEAALYRYLDAVRPEKVLAAGFAREDPEQAAAVARAGVDGTAALVDLWAAAGLVLRDSGSVLALAVRRAGDGAAAHALGAPVRYLAGAA